jgi:excisionase family DNA binding protein
MNRHLRDDLLTVSQVAEYCLVCERTVRRWIKAGELPALRLGRQLRIRDADLVRFLDRRAE